MFPADDVGTPRRIIGSSPMDMCTNGEALAVLANTAIQFRDGMNGLHDRVLRTARADCSKKHCGVLQVPVKFLNFPPPLVRNLL